MAMAFASDAPSHQTAAKMDSDLLMKGHDAAYTAGSTIVDTGLKGAESVSSAAHQAVEATQGVIYTGNTMLDRAFDTMRDGYLWANEMAKHSPTVKAFMTMFALLATPPVIGYFAYAATTAASTFGGWAVLELGLLGFGLLFLVPVLGVCMAIAAGGAFIVVLAMATMSISRGIYNRVLGHGSGMGMGGGPSAGSSRYGTIGGRGGPGWEKTKKGVADATGTAWSSGQKAVSTAAETIKEAASQAIEGGRAAAAAHDK